MFSFFFSLFFLPVGLPEYVNFYTLTSQPVTFDSNGIPHPSQLPPPLHPDPYSPSGIQHTQSVQQGVPNYHDKAVNNSIINSPSSGWQQPGSSQNQSLSQQQQQNLQQQQQQQQHLQPPSSYRVGPILAAGTQLGPTSHGGGYPPSTPSLFSSASNLSSIGISSESSIYPPPLGSSLNSGSTESGLYFDYNPWEVNEKAVPLFKGTDNTIFSAFFGPEIQSSLSTFKFQHGLYSNNPSSLFS